MSEPTIVELELRMNKLEQNNRWLKWSVALMAIVSVAGLITFGRLPRVSSQPLMGQTIEAEQLVIKDSIGRVRAILGRIDPPSSSPEPVYGLSIQGQDGESEARLTDWNLHIHHGKGLVSLSPISVDISRHKANVAPLLKGLVRLNKQQLTKQEETDLNRLVAELEPEAKFYLNMAGPYLEITKNPRDQVDSGAGIAKFGVSPHPSVELRSLSDETSFSLTALKDSAGMSMRDSQGKRRATLNVDSDAGAAINLYDKDGKTIRATF